MNSTKIFKTVALLPMKANSSRIPGKNFRDFCGKPLYRWILETLLEVKEIDKIIINTDARDILEEDGLKETKKILIRDRKREICGDDVSMNLVLEDDIRNVNSEMYLMSHTTNPLLKSETIKTAINTFAKERENNRYDSLFSVNKIQSRFYKANSDPINHNPRALIPTQELEPWYEENSNLYIFNKESFYESNARIGKKPLLFQTPIIESIDIDTNEDWELACAICKSRQQP